MLSLYKNLTIPCHSLSLKAMPELADLALVRQGNRLSLMPVSEAQWQVILGLCQR
jgi:predicted RNA-binding protein with PUA-like domain